MSEENKEETKVKEEKSKKNDNFFRQVWHSITKIEKYPELASKGLGKAFVYLSKLVAILAIILCIGWTYQTYQLIQDGIVYMQNDFPEFSYKDGTLDVKSEDVINISSEDSILGETIIDTKTEDVNIENQYRNQIEEAGSGIVILKNKAILKNPSVAGTITYEYKESFSKMGITEFTKQDVINYANSSQSISVYASMFLTTFVYSFIMYLLTTLVNVVVLSVFGYLTTLITRIKMRYVAVFNMSVYAITLSIILNMIYIAINIFVSFTMEYFQVMYVAVAAIYLVAAIFLLKDEFNKKQAELMKIAEAQAIVKKELEEKKNEEQKDKEKNKKEDEKDEEEKERKKNNEKEKNEDTNIGKDPGTSNA